MMTTTNAKKCACGCGGTVNPGRRFMQGHNQRNVKYSTPHPVLKMKHNTRRKRRRSAVVATWYAKGRILKELEKRSVKLNELIETIREVL